MLLNEDCRSVLEDIASHRNLQLLQAPASTYLCKHPCFNDVKRLIKLRGDVRSCWSTIKLCSVVTITTIEDPSHCLNQSYTSDSIAKHKDLPYPVGRLTNTSMVITRQKGTNYFLLFLKSFYSKPSFGRLDGMASPIRVRVDPESIFF